jgi:RimJ/RimL family protein N-acetyltransferase
MGIQVRRADADDIPWLVSQLECFNQFFAARRSLFDEAYTRDKFLPPLISHHLVLIAVGAAGDRMGFIAGMIMPHLFNPSIRTLMELFWWVSPEHRGSRAGLMLLNAFTDWGKANVDWVTLSLEHDSPIKEESMVKRGYRLKERAFLMEVS